MAQFTGGTLFPISFGTNLFADQFDSLQVENWLGSTASAQTPTSFTMSLPASLDIQYTNSYGDIENIDIVGAVSRAVICGNDLGNRIVGPAAMASTRALLKPASTICS